MQLTLLGLVAILLLIWLFLRRRARLSQDKAPPPAPARGDSRYHAVSIRFSANACAAAKGMSGQRFLASAAPQLPLPECDVASCECRFSHHPDRRTGKDRRSPFASGGPTGASGRYEKERRGRPDRRKNA